MNEKEEIEKLKKRVAELESKLNPKPANCYHCGGTGEVAWEGTCYYCSGTGICYYCNGLGDSCGNCGRVSRVEPNYDFPM